MPLSDIISVSGLPGLHKVLTHTKTGLIVESLLDGKRRPIYASQKVSALEDISIYTEKEDLPLTDILKLIHDKEKGKKALSHKEDPSKLREYLTGLVKDLDHDRVYNSDIAKLFQWYNTLAEKDLLDFEEEKEEDTDKDDGKTPAKKKTTAKKKVVTKTGVDRKGGARSVNTPKAPKQGTSRKAQ